MASLNRSYTTSYQSVCHIGPKAYLYHFPDLTLKNIVTIKCEFMYGLYIAEIYTHGTIFAAETTGLSPVTCKQRAPVKHYSKSPKLVGVRPPPPRTQPQLPQYPASCQFSTKIPTGFCPTAAEKGGYELYREVVSGGFTYLRPLA